MISANQKLYYSISLLLSKEIKKTSASLARTIEVKEHVIWKCLKENQEVVKELKALTVRIFGKKAIHLIIDDTIIAKIFSKYIEGSSDNYNSSKNKAEWGLCSVVAMITDGKKAIPISLRNWQQEEFVQEDYKSKVELAKELIEEITKEIEIDIIIMDGLYARDEMIRWLIDRNLSFEMRMHTNRKVKTEDGELAQLKDHNKFKLGKKQIAKTIRALWNNMLLYITVVKRFNKKGDYQIIYQVSNYDASPEKHKKVYAFRWKIEKFFRTAKQSLGLTHCQSRKLDLQINHQLNVFLTYAILQLEQVKLRLDSPEKALKRLKKKNYKQLLQRLQATHQIFEVAHA
jgi:hypothetical protein